MIDISALKATAPTNEILMFKLTIENILRILSYCLKLNSHCCMQSNMYTLYIGHPG